jgi:peptide/nickel transport system ATP-binding protein
MSENALLEIANLRIAIDGKFPVDGAGFSVHGREFVALVGASGSGKTLTALSVIGLLPTAAAVEGGEINFDGCNLLAFSEKEWRKVRGREIGMIFQEPMTSLNPVMTVGAQLREAIRTGLGGSRSQIRAAALEALRAVQMPEPEMRMRAYPHQLSGGLRQRAMIAMALACRPALLIADEPTTALDVTIQAGIMRLLREIRAERELAVILITHDIALAAEVSDRIIVMRAGRIVEEGIPSEIIGRPSHPYTQDLIEHCRRREAQ